MFIANITLPTLTGRNPKTLLLIFFLLFDEETATYHRWLEISMPIGPN